MKRSRGRRLKPPARAPSRPAGLVVKSPAETKCKTHHWRRVFVRMSAPTPYAGDVCQVCKSPRIRLFFRLTDTAVRRDIPAWFAELVEKLLWGAIGPENEEPSRIVKAPAIVNARGEPLPRPVPFHIPGPKV